MTRLRAGRRDDIRVFGGLETLSREAAMTFIEASEESILQSGRFTTAISGGLTPRRLYRLLASTPYLDAVAWPKVDLFWADERCTSPDSEESNHRLVKETLLSKVPLPPDNIHRIRAEMGAEAAATEYERELRDFFGHDEIPVFDLILLGLGREGHTASLFPGSPALSATDRLAAPVYMEDGPDRVTLTLPVLNNASRVVFLVSGPDKAEIVKAVLYEEEHGKIYPAGLVNPTHGSLTWLLDEGAAKGAEAAFTSRGGG